MIAFLILSIIAVNIWRFILNKKIYKSLGYQPHDLGKVTYAETVEDARKGDENFIFYLFCFFTLIWVPRNRVRFISNLLTILTIFLSVIILFTI